MSDVTPEQPVADEPVVDDEAVDLTELPVDETDHDEEDVKAALERSTTDGSGFDNESDLPAEDFDGFAENDVEESD